MQDQPKTTSEKVITAICLLLSPIVLPLFLIGTLLVLFSSPFIIFGTSISNSILGRNDDPPFMKKLFGLK